MLRLGKRMGETKGEVSSSGMKGRGEVGKEAGR